ncbi:MAG TPA: FGGY family carbohydrate kinase [Aggregatilineaceae bacterium]|nr:FGGY family carbohydrate kinase [Aggregatilineaceae bacterium]
MNQEYLLAMDIGTQSARAGLFDTAGNLVASAAQDYDLQMPAPGWAQQDPEYWWKASRRNIRSLLDQTGVAPAHVRGIAVDSQMHATIPVGREGRVLVPAVQLWCDKRTAGIVREFSRDQGRERMLSLAANMPTTAWLGFKIKWLQRHQPDVYRRTWQFLTGGAFIVYRMTGAMALSLAEASGSFCMDAQKEVWSDDLIGWLGIDRDKLPPIAPATSIAGYVTHEAARLTGLTAGTPVAVGASDFMATLLAAGLTRPGRAVDISGTSCLMAIATPVPIADQRLMHLHHETEGWVAYGVVETGGGALRWFRDNFCLAERLLAEQTRRDVYDILGDQAGTISPGAEGVLFFPYLLGERTLGSPHSRGVFFGLLPGTDRATLTRAIMEGISFELKRVLEIVERNGLTVEQIRAVGGGASSPIWNQIRADVYNKPVVQFVANEGGLLGSAILAGLATGVWPDASSAVSVMSRIDTVISPNPANRERYDQLFALFKDLHDRLLPAFEHLHRIVGQEE